MIADQEMHVEVSTHGGWQVATGRGASGGFTAWAKMGRIQSDCPIKEPGEHVWFNFGATREEARRRVLEEVGLCPEGGWFTVIAPNHL